MRWLFDEPWHFFDGLFVDIFSRCRRISISSNFWADIAELRLLRNAIMARWLDLCHIHARCCIGFFIRSSIAHSRQHLVRHWFSADFIRLHQDWALNMHLQWRYTRRSFLFSGRLVARFLAHFGFRVPDILSMAGRTLYFDDIIDKIFPCRCAISLAPSISLFDMLWHFSLYIILKDSWFAFSVPPPRNVYARHITRISTCQRKICAADYFQIDDTLDVAIKKG